MTGYFEEKEGVKSINRVNTSLLIWAGLFIALFSVFAPAAGLQVDTGQNYMFSLTLIGTGLGGKLIQKPMEK